MLSAAPACFSPTFCPPFSAPGAITRSRSGSSTTPHHALPLAGGTCRGGAPSRLRSSRTAGPSFLSVEEAEVDADYRDLWLFPQLLAAAFSGAEGRLLSLLSRMKNRVQLRERMTLSGVVLSLVSAVFFIFLKAAAHIFGSFARLAGASPDGTALLELEEEEEDVTELLGEVPALQAMRIEHLAATKYGGHKALKKEVAAMEVVRKRVLQLSAEEREGMDQSWLDNLKPVDLLRYVRGNGCDGAMAAEKLIGTAVWRQEFGVSNILQEKETTIDGFFAGQVHEVDWLDKGADLEQGRPSLLYRSAVHHPQDIPTERWVRFFVHQCEWARVHYPNDQVLVLVDRVGSGLSNQDPTVLRALAPVIIDHYPDTIGRVLISPVNNVLYIIWGLVSLILDETTKARMKLVKGKKWKKALVKYMDPEALPERLGGTNTVL